MFTDGFQTWCFLPVLYHMEQVRIAAIKLLLQDETVNRKVASFFFFFWLKGKKGCKGTCSVDQSNQKELLMTSYG